MTVVPLETAPSKHALRSEPRFNGAQAVRGERASAVVAIILVPTVKACPIVVAIDATLHRFVRWGGAVAAVVIFDGCIQRRNRSKADQ
jgi:hypothetical protein